MHRLFAVFAIVAVTAGCQKKPADDSTNSTEPESAPEQPTEPAEPTEAQPPAEDVGEVRPPTAEDLATYTEGLEGDGPLMAEFKTSMGTFNCELFEKDSPMTVANFVGLARGLKPFKNPKTGQVEKRPFYDGIVFHRVIPGFMIQTGDPLGIGSGGPGYTFADEFKDNRIHDKPGTLSMANRGPGTNGSQIFITERPTPHLDRSRPAKGHTVFGHCKELDVIKTIARVEKDPSDRSQSRPATPVVIEKLTITRGG